jgi:hypothetical protein
MPQRLDSDGPLTVTRIGGDHLSIRVVTEGKEETICCSHYNALRLCGTILLMLQFPMPKWLLKLKM